MLDQRGQLLRAAVGFAGCSMPLYHGALLALRTWLDSWAGIGHVAVGMHRHGFDLQLTQYDDRGWRATFYTAGMEHSADERDRHRVGAHAVARDAASRVEALKKPERELKESEVTDAPPAPLAPHQPRPARDAAHATQRAAWRR